MLVARVFSIACVVFGSMCRIDGVCRIDKVCWLAFVSCDVGVLEFLREQEHETI